MVKNNQPLEIDLQNIVINLRTIDQTVNEIKSTLSIEFDEELSTMMIISKKGYNLNSTVNFLNRSVEELIEKRKRDKSIVEKNTVEFIKENLDTAKIKLDSSSARLNTIKVQEKLTDEKGDVSGILQNINTLEQKRAEIITKVNALNAVRNSVGKNLDNIINLNAAGVEDWHF